MNRTIHFLSGLPRTGSTVLGALLSQNPAIHVTPTSPLANILVSVAQGIGTTIQYAYDHQRTYERIYDAVAEIVYSDIDRPIIFDKNRFWPGSVDELRRLAPEPKIVCTVRPIPEIVASYIAIAEKHRGKNFLDEQILRDGQPITNDNRAAVVCRLYLQEHLQVINEGLQSHPQNILLVEYDDLIYTPHEVLNRIYAFCEMEHYRHDITSIANNSGENDGAWGMPGLHDVRGSLAKTSTPPEEILSPQALMFVDQFKLGAEETCHDNLSF
jgi:sulfotransferase